MKQCKEDNCTNNVFSSGYCKQHLYRVEKYRNMKLKSHPGSTISSKTIQSTAKKRSFPIQSKNKKWDHNFYIKWWQKQNIYCEECLSEVIYYSPRNIHHLIERNQQDKYSIDIQEVEELLMKLCNVCHDQVRLNIDKVPTVKKRTEEMLLKYEPYKVIR